MVGSQMVCSCVLTCVWLQETIWLLRRGLRVVGVEEGGAAQAGMVLEGNAAALPVEYCRGDVAKAVQWVGPELTC